MLKLVVNDAAVWSQRLSSQRMSMVKVFVFVIWVILPVPLGRVHAIRLRHTKRSCAAIVPEIEETVETQLVSGLGIVLLYCPASAATWFTRMLSMIKGERLVAWARYVLLTLQESARV